MNMPDTLTVTQNVEKPLVMVLAETSWGRLERVGLELLSDARKLAGSLKGRVEVALLCSKEQSSGLLSDLDGVVREPIHVVENDGLAEFSTELYLSGLVQILQQLKPQVLFMAATANGRSVGPRLAARLGCGYFPHCLLVKAATG